MSRPWGRPARKRPAARPCDPVDRYWALKIARASYLLSSTQFRVYSLIIELDRPDVDPARIGGCFLGEVELSQQCGRSVDVVMDARADLVRYQLVECVQLPGTRQAFWFVRLPPGIADHPPADVQGMRKGGAKDDEIRRWLRGQGDALDRHIREKGGEVAPYSPRPAAPKGGQSHRATGGDFTPPAPRKGGDFTHDGGQRRPPSEHENAGSAAPSDSLKRSDSQSDSLPAPPLSDSPDGAPSKASEAGTAASRKAQGSPGSLAALLRPHAPALADEYGRATPDGELTDPRDMDARRRAWREAVPQAKAPVRGATLAAPPPRRSRAALDACPACGCQRQYIPDGARACPRCWPAGAGDGWDDRAAAARALLAHLRTHVIALILRDGQIALGASSGVQLSDRDRAAVRAFELELRTLLEPETAA